MMTEKNLKQAFDLFDLDQNGYITPRELKHILGDSETMNSMMILWIITIKMVYRDQEIKDEEWEKIIEEFDKNSDGMINFEEFK
jgi:Ca2+-binding EF-hand superfamily protein